MDLTPDRKAYIDSLTHYELLNKIRFTLSGDEWMQGETGEYWIKRRGELRDQDPGRAVADSKALAWR